MDRWRMCLGGGNALGTSGHHIVLGYTLCTLEKMCVRVCEDPAETGRDGRDVVGDSAEEMLGCTLCTWERMDGWGGEGGSMGYIQTREGVCCVCVGGGGVVFRREKVCVVCVCVCCMCVEAPRGTGSERDAGWTVMLLE